MLERDGGLVDATQRLQVRARERDVLRLSGRAARAHVPFGRLAGQGLFPALDLGVDEGAQGFVFADRHASRELLVALDLAEAMLAAERGVLVLGDDPRKQGVLHAHRSSDVGCDAAPLDQPHRPQVERHQRVGNPGARRSPRRAVPAPEGRKHLCPEALRVRAVHDSDFVDGSALRQVPGAEQQVPDDGRIAEVAARGLRILRVVPAVRFGAAHDVVEPAVAQVQVAVLEEAVDGIKEEVAGDHIG